MQTPKTEPGAAARAPRAVPRPTDDDLAFATVVALGKLLRTRQISPVELARLYLERCKKYDPKLYCIVNLTEERALEEARRAEAEIVKGRYRGPLHGVPWGAKDLLATRGIPTTWGAKPYENQVFDYDATVVRRLTEAGAVLVAKLSMGELAQGARWFREMTRNPWDVTRSSSGSSAGPGSATAAGLVGFSIGTETLGSIISPSSTCGIAGLRPTFGRVSRHGAMALAWSMDKIGPMCRGVEDCALVLAAIAGPDSLDPTVADAPLEWNPRRPIAKMRIGIVRAEFDAVRDEEAKTIFDEALKVIETAGAKLEPIELPDYPYEGLRSILSCEAAAAFDELARSDRIELLRGQERGDWPNTFRSYRMVPAVDYIRAQRVRTMLVRDAVKATEKFDAFVSPGGTGTGPRIGAPPAAPAAAAASPRPAGAPGGGARTLTMTNLTGHPSIVVPCGFRRGLPVGLVFSSNLFDEGAALRLALAYESATDWHRKRPAL